MRSISRSSKKSASRRISLQSYRVCYVETDETDCSSPSADAERASPGRGPAMAGGDGARLVFRARLAGGKQLHPGHRDQRTGDVASRYLRSTADRYGTRLGRRT